MHKSFATIVAVAAVVVVVADAGAQSRGFAPETQELLDRLKEEPTIQQAQQAALRFFRIDPETIGSMRGRAGWKSVLPSIEVAARKSDLDIDIDKFDITAAPIDELAGRDNGVTGVLEFGVKGSWDLSRLVFNPEVLDVSSLVVLQESILKEITRIYYTRRRLQVDIILNPPTDPATRLSKELRVEELTSTLDAMTGNLFTKSTQKRARRPRDDDRRRRRRDP